ncbi:MAG: hypothetical protein KBD60_10665 [Sterolibacterium sp.]|jgi:hypothetical protein|nr:hypothetical protein [Sterolibacterium sp.]
MTARENEAGVLNRCSRIARALDFSAQNAREANVFRLAALVMTTRFPEESKRLMQASQRYFADHPGEQLAPGAVVRNGWVISLPRLRAMLTQRFSVE